jgi:hypothetical protein
MALEPTKREHSIFAHRHQSKENSRLIKWTSDFARWYDRQQHYTTTRPAIDIIPRSSVERYTILYYTILYYTILYYTILYYTMPLSLDQSLHGLFATPPALSRSFLAAFFVVAISVFWRWLDN